MSENLAIAMGFTKMPDFYLPKQRGLTYFSPFAEKKSEITVDFREGINYLKYMRQPASWRQ